MRIHLVIFLLLCTPSIINQTYWHRLLLLFLADATDIVMIEAEKPQTQLKDQTKLKDGEKSKQVQIGLFADRMVTTYVGSYFPKLEERWQKAYESGGMNRHEYEGKMRLLYKNQRLGHENKVQVVQGRDGGKSYAIGFSGNSVVLHNFAKAIEAKQDADPKFQLKSSKELAKIVNQAFQETKEQMGGKLEAHQYLVTNGRSKYTIRVGDNGLKSKLFGSKPSIKRIDSKSKVQTQGFELERMRERVDKLFGRKSADDPVVVGSDRELLNNVDTAFAQQSLVMGRPNAVSASTQGVLFEPVEKESRFARLKRQLAGGKLPAPKLQMHNRFIEEEEHDLRSRYGHGKSLDQIIGDLEKGGHLEEGEAEQARAHEQQQQQSSSSSSNDWNLHKPRNSLKSRNPFRGGGRSASSSSSARNEKPPPVPSGTKWARNLRKNIGKTARKSIRKIFG